jgi:hypothetical protein
MSRRPSLNRRSFLQNAAAATAAVSVAEWLDLFRTRGVPGTSSDWGFAKARAGDEGQAGGPTEDRYLVYWYVEGGWDSYSMLSPVDTPNNSALSIPANTLNPTPSWSDHRYRPRDFGGATRPAVQVSSGIKHGYLAADGADLLADAFVLSSLKGNTFHSGGRFDLHYGNYNRNLADRREDDERSVMQAFAEAKGSSFLLPHISWHRWLADGELDLGQFPEGHGYAEQLGPAYAHTIYGRTPRDLKARLAAVGDVSKQVRRRVVRDYSERLHEKFLRGRDSGQSVKAFASALEIHRSLSDRQGNFDLRTLFDDEALKAHFGLRDGDEFTTATSVNGNPARSKESPHIRAQAMMAYELMRAKVSCALWLESRDVRLFDSHKSRSGVLNDDSNSDQANLVRDEIWSPLRAFIQQLKATAMPGTSDGTTMYDRTTIVLCSEMGRSIQGDVSTIVADASRTVEARYQDVLDQDVCQHWHVSSAAFFGGSVRPATQAGGVGNQTLDIIPITSSGDFDPAFDAVTGLQRQGQTQTGFIPDAGHLYATALQLAGVDPVGKGRNNRPPLTFVQRS